MSGHQFWSQVTVKTHLKYIWATRTRKKETLTSRSKLDLDRPSSNQLRTTLTSSQKYQRSRWQNSIQSQRRNSSRGRPKATQINAVASSTRCRRTQSNAWPRCTARGSAQWAGPKFKMYGSPWPLKCQRSPGHSLTDRTTQLLATRRRKRSRGSTAATWKINLKNPLRNHKPTWTISIWRSASRTSC